MSRAMPVAASASIRPRTIRHALESSVSRSTRASRSARSTTGGNEAPSSTTSGAGAAGASSLVHVSTASIVATASA
jgi:hypothetical protein